MTQFYACFSKRSAFLFLSMLFFLNSGFSTTVPNNKNLTSENVALFNGDITLNCPSDITLTANPGQTGTSASWNAPTPSTTCVNTSGCTEKTLVQWGLDQCTLVGSDKYREFRPAYPSNGGCSSVTATNVYRDFPLTYPHSCVTGVSGKAMCITSTQFNHYVENHGYAVKFSATINSNNVSKFSKLTFYAASPRTSFFTNGDSRANNYLRKFGVRVKRNGTVIFSKDNLPLTNDFELQTIDFGNLLGVSSGSAKFDFELMAYDPVGNGNTHRVWDLDEIKLKGCCGNTSPGNVTVTQIAGPPSGSSFPVGNTTITYRATDDCGNTKDCSFLVKVNPSPKASVGNVVWNDLDNDGIKDNGEPGIANVTVKLQAPNGNTLQTTTTNNNGFYSFANLDAGDYKIMFNSPSGFNPASRTGFGDNNTDNNNDNNPATGMTDVFTLSPGEDNSTIDAGFNQPMTTYDCPNLSANIGDSCNDGKPNTINDQVNSSCECVGKSDNGADCNNVTATGSDGKVTINNIPSGAKIEISGPSTSWAQQIVCESNCNEMQMVSNLTAGNYNIAVQTYNPYCYKLYSVTVTGGGGNPCDNQGGDSDGDGICDSQDNCKYKANADQSDNDGDGIGNVCDATPNGGDNGGGDCKSVTVTGESGKVTISDIPSSAKVEIFGPSTGWNHQLVCSSDCGSSQMVTSLTAGTYNVTVQTFNPYCYKQYTVTVTGGGGGGGNPCDNQGGDSDGDGICDSQDNCKYKANADQLDNDGDGIGNICDATPNGGDSGGGDCNSVTVTGESGKVTISDIPSSAKVEILGPSTGWNHQLVCSSDCSSSQMVTSLTAGTYNVTVQTFNPYCYKQYTVTVTGGGGGNPCDNQGGDSDGDGICDSQDNCKYKANADQSDNDGDGIGNICDATPNGGDSGGGDCNSVTVTGESGKVTISDIPSSAKVEILGPSTGWNHQLVCSSDCSSSQMVTSLTAGTYNVTVQTFNPYCYKQYTVTVTGGGGGNPCDNQGGDSDGDGICDSQDNCKYKANADQSDNDGDGIGNVCDATPNGGDNGGGDCNSVTVTGESGKVTISDIPSSAKVEIFGPSTGWNHQLVCSSDCGSSQMVTSLTAGTYNVTVQTFNPYCYKQYTVTVTGGGGGNPCDNQGGDSDGDGVCDNQDNCQFTANSSQADNDGDGIGNVCDATPDGEPCANQGGDSDGDGVCDNQDNCRFTANSNQLDSDGDGIGDACDAPAGCNSGLLAHWDLNACEAATRVTDSGDYSEFVAQTNNLGCTEVHASNVYRKNPSTNKHSCAGGVSGSGMCVQVEGLCTFRPDDISAIRFELTVDPTNGNSSKLTELNFFASSPQQSIFGVNNYLQKMGVRVTKNGQEIYSSIDIPTTRTSTYQSFDFSNDPDFTVTSTTTFKFELLGYCAVGNGSQDKIFDIDEVKILGCCTNSANSRNAPMLDFTAFPVQREVELQWLTNTGYKNDYFEIEKSTDSITFETLQRVENLDFTDDLEFYNGIDPTPVLGDNYYRIKQVYTDGSFDYTDVQSILFNIDLDKFSMYPNPAQNELFVNLKSHAGQKGILTLMNQFGQLVRRIDLTEISEDILTINTSNVGNGLYYLNVEVDNQRAFTKKVIIHRLY